MKHVKRVRLLDRLSTRFDTEDLVSQPFVLPEVIVPITNIDALALDSKAQQESAAAASRTDTFTVPDGKRWTVNFLRAGRDNAGSITFSVVIDGITVDLEILASGTAMEDKPNNLILNEADSVLIVYGIAASGTLRSSILYQEEDAF